ncbi:hypothetical protein FS749_008189 [Ceratobasidium sp. UAMH 11750]|nr:hypothetical protein FS749_008189 [Ceratobasidium sp. UAMH 11750]
MTQSRILAQGIFVSYFAIILALFGLILHSLRQLALKPKPRAQLFLGLAFGSLCHTWFYMINFLLWSFHNFEARHPLPARGESVSNRMTNWLMGSELFEQAWRRVCEGPMNWWWSEQLCILTVGVWTTFLFVQGSRRRIPHVWAYMLLGQLVAISVATNLFFAAVLLAPVQAATDKEKHPLRIPPRVYIPVLLSHMTVLISPTVAHPSSGWFLPNLLTMHALIVLPLIGVPHIPIPLPSTNSDTKAICPDVDPKTFYLFLAALALVPRAQTYLSLLHSNRNALGLIQDLWATLHEHPAQSSIGYDVIWTTVSFAAYCSSALGIVSPGLALYLDDIRQD